MTHFCKPANSLSFSYEKQSATKHSTHNRLSSSRLFSPPEELSEAWVSLRSRQDFASLGTSHSWRWGVQAEKKKKWANISSSFCSCFLKVNQGCGKHPMACRFSPLVLRPGTHLTCGKIWTVTRQQMNIGSHQQRNSVLLHLKHLLNIMTKELSQK